MLTPVGTSLRNKGLFVECQSIPLRYVRIKKEGKNFPLEKTGRSVTWDNMCLLIRRSFLGIIAMIFWPKVPNLNLIMKQTLDNHKQEVSITITDLYSSKISMSFKTKMRKCPGKRSLRRYYH